jgi:Asp-tRNA(Asn)/Glu-tRNA(Gln) amidotransferase A subunit family amidase
VTAGSRSLTERSALELAAAIRDGRTTAREVVEAHIAVLERVQPRINPLAAERFDAAREEAAAADARIAGAGSQDELPALLGVPCTIKEAIAMRGMPNCAGLVSRRRYRAPEHAPAVARLLDAGAIPLGVTNTAELCLWLETHNYVYGRTSNAYDPSRIAGGSSGGDGAVVGSGGAPFSLGSDIAGSIRLPAFFNGVFGHFPTTELFPPDGHFPVPTGQGVRMLAIGPLARRAEDLMPVLRIVAGSQADQLGDPAAVSLHGLDVILSERTALLPVRREMRGARERAAAALAAGGARVRHVELRSLRRALELYLVALVESAGLVVGELIVQEGGEAVGWRALLRRGGPHTVATRAVIAAQRLGSLLPSRYLRRAVAAGRALADEADAVIGDGVLLHPPHPRVAPAHGRTVGRPWLLAYTAVFNLLGLPCTEVPLGLNRQGLPLGVQVAGRRGRDHVTIAVALELERALGGWVPPPARGRPISSSVGDRTLGKPEKQTDA